MERKRSIVVNTALYTDLKIAQEILGLKGGEIGKTGAVLKLEQHIDKGENAPFMDEVFKKYGIKKKLKKILRKNTDGSFQ